MKIHLIKLHLTGKETQYIEEPVKSGKIFVMVFLHTKCQQFFEFNYIFKKKWLLTS